MNHRHLLPSEIDLLLDDEEGFGVAPLKTHVRACAECQLKLEEARVVTDAIEELPHFAPSFRFADAVMAQVPVYVPWHVAARDTVQKWVPLSRPARVAAVALASSVASLLTVAILWISTRTDLLVFASSLAGNRAQELLLASGRDALVSMFGAPALTLAGQAGPAGLSALAGGFLAAVIAATFGLRAIAVASSRRRT